MKNYKKCGNHMATPWQTSGSPKISEGPSVVYLGGCGWITERQGLVSYLRDSSMQPGRGCIRGSWSIDFLSFLVLGTLLCNQAGVVYDGPWVSIFLVFLLIKEPPIQDAAYVYLAPGASTRRQEEPGRARRSQEAPASARRSQEEPGGDRGSQEEPGRAGKSRQER